MYVNQQVQIETNSINVQYNKAIISTFNTIQSIESCQINIPSFCNDLLVQYLNCANSVLTQKVSGFYFI